MRSVPLGGSGFEVSALGLGCMSMSDHYGPVDNEESLKTLARAADLGVTFWDTADVYGAGANERLLARFFASGRRDEITLATKFGGVVDDDGNMTMNVRGEAAYVPRACDASLRRLGVDHIDLYYIHIPDPKVEITETVGAMAELVAAGKVRALGLSNVSPEQIRAAARVHPIAAVQMEWSLFDRGVEESVLPACAEVNASLVAYSPLGRGFLTGVYTSSEGLDEADVRRAVPRFNEENRDHNTSLLRPIEEIAEARGVTRAQVALAWLMRQRERFGAPVVPIPSMRRLSRLEENSGAAETELTDSDLAALEPIAQEVRGSNRPPLPPEIAERFGLK
ncbi:aldo/keto reductase [Nocardiopsis dassonvillei]|uniref:aldo/keto reductase n=1 Tax=Nocardiopsis dassonvillei TaxID=2014 RepID=UPI00200BA45F|nr:aldo/keto reductase [Nocardiopsis dassonvillei]MCK9868530.1 aldo/keto reductase [Nocardiopsis dassonvillei]